MRAMLCRCRCHLEAEDDQRLCELLRSHLVREHEAPPLDEEQIGRIVAERAYEQHYALVGYEDGVGPDEEFGLEPY